MILNEMLTVMLCAVLLVLAFVRSQRRGFTLLAAVLGLLAAAFVLPFLLNAAGFSASAMALPWRIIRALLTLFGGDPVSARTNEALGYTSAAMADLWTIPSLLGAPIAALIHSRMSRKQKASAASKGR